MIHHYIRKTILNETHLIFSKMLLINSYKNNMTFSRTLNANKKNYFNRFHYPQSYDAITFLSRPLEKKVI